LLNYIPEKEERIILIEKIVSQFVKRKIIFHRLNDNSYLILSKDERKIKNLKRYENSPLPLFSNLESFSCSIGDFNEELLQYGITSRLQYGDLNSETETLYTIGSKIHLVYYKTLTARGNRYLRRQYHRLREFRHYKNVSGYWKLSWTLMLKSWSFRLTSLNSWSPTWDKTYSYLELRKIFKNLNKILNLETLQTQILNVWIESPKDKGRQLGIPEKGERLFLHMMNMFLCYIYEPQLPHFCNEPML
jgi:hypothetical protein